MSSLMLAKLSLVVWAVFSFVLLSTVPVEAKRHPNWQRPEYGQHVKVLPRGFRTIRSHHGDHYYRRGIFYRHYDNFYRVVRPPLGLIIATLPMGYIDVRFGDRVYARYNDVYYAPSPRGYMVVESPPSAPPPPQPDVNAIPANALGVVAVTVEVLNVRSGPGILHSVVDHVSAGDELMVLATAPEWYYVRLSGGGYGWVRTQFVRGTLNVVR